MKYANSLKYMNSFPTSGDISDISLKRVRELCESLGRVNIGTKYIFIPGGTAGHASAVMLESVIKSAGYCVGKISSESDFDSRGSVFVNGEIPQIEDYNKCVAELKGIIGKDTNTVYYKEEVVFALSLLITKLTGCDYVILEGLSDKGVSFDSLCAPYDLIVIPTLYSAESSEVYTKTVCDAIKRGAREVVSGNQKSAVYSHIMDYCMSGGIRLDFTAKPSFVVNEVSSRRISFSYADREGYTLKSPSHLLRDCAMLTIESALAIRRDGVKIPWNSIITGLSSASDSFCFDTISVSPLILVDGSSCMEEVKLMMTTANDVFSDEEAEKICLCIPASVKDTVCAFDSSRISKIMVLSDAEDFDTLETQYDTYSNIKDMAKDAHNASFSHSSVICFGSVSFAMMMKSELLRIMNG